MTGLENTTPKMKIPRFNLLDAGLISISLLPLISCHNGLCSTVSANVACQSLLGLSLYTLGRELFIFAKYNDYIFEGGGLLMTVIAVFSLITFCIFRNAAIDAGFDNIYYLRSLFKPFGYTNNKWSEIALAFTAFSMIAGRFRHILMFISIISTIITFSRGAYMALFLLLFLMITVSHPKQRTRILCISACSILLVFVFCHKEMLTTLSIHSTYSQKASTEWRINTTKSSIRNVREHILAGYGCGSYTMISDTEFIDSFCSFAPSLPVLLLVENGILGLGAFACMALFCGLKIWRYRKDEHIRGIACILFVIFLKEASQATLLHTKYLYFLTILLLAYVSSFHREKIKLRIGRYAVLLASCSAFVFSSVFWGYNNGKMISNDIKAGIDLLKSKKMNDTEQIRVIENLRKASRKEPFDNYIKYILAEINIQQGKVKEGAAQLSELNKKHPNNAIFAFSCGNAFFFLGDKDKAIGYWKQGIILYPRLLLCKEYLNIESCDPILFNCLNNAILRSYPKGKQINGKVSAKWGFILNKFGKTKESIRILNHSVSELPNLSVPWLLLNIPQKYNFLTNGLFFNYNTSMKVEDYATFKLNDLLTAIYGVRFKTWYADNL